MNAADSTSPRGIPSGRIVRPGESEDINEVSLMKWNWNKETFFVSNEVL